MKATSYPSERGIPGASRGPSRRTPLEGMAAAGLAVARAAAERRPPITRPGRRRCRFASVLLVAGALLALVAGTALAAGPGQPVPATGRTTAVLVSATNAPLRVRGDDGMEHLEYDLVITNVFTAPVTLTAIEVTDPDGRVLFRLEGDALTASTRPVFLGAPTNEVPVAGAVATIMDVVVPPGRVPGRIGHRIAYDLPADAPARTLIGSLVVAGPELAVDPRPPLVIAPPLRGDGWFNASGCCLAAAQHRDIRIAVDGARIVKAELFAIDWARWRDGHLAEGDGARNEQYYGFGAAVLSVAEGTVVAVRDDMPDETPLQPPVAVQRPEDYGGNAVVVQIRPDVWALYGHLQRGSVTVRAGDRVTTGQVLGRLGNSGNSTAPHLHFQLSDGPDVLTSTSLPFVFDRYTLAGRVSLEAYAASVSAEDPLPIDGPPRAQAGTYPLFLSVVGFP